jgi:tetratricopeptide (TPR) repeat protein
MSSVIQPVGASALPPVSPRRYFISHASPEKALALDIKARLGDSTWVDLHEIRVGDVLLEEISSAIEAATDFVLLWSEASAASAWVRYEFHMAFIRYLEDQAIDLRVVRIDSTPVPLFLRPLLQARDTDDAAEIAALLREERRRARALRRFLNRAPEIQVAESTLFSAEKGFAWYYGLSGIGKRALTREAQRRLMADPLRRIRVEVRPGTGFVELHLSLCAAARVALPKQALDEAQAEDAAREILRTLTEQGALWLFEDVQHWLDEDARPNTVLQTILHSLLAGGVESPERAALFTSTRRPSLDAEHEEHSTLRRVAGLTTDYALALMRPSAPPSTSDDQLLAAARQLEGHPLALQLAASRLHGTELDWEGLRVATAQGILTDLNLTETTQLLLETLATVSGPLPGAAIAGHLQLDDEAFREAVQLATSYSLVQDEAGFLHVHPLVRDFFLRALRSRRDHDARVTDLANRSREMLQRTPTGSAIYVESLFATFRLLSLSGRLSEALKLHSGLFGTLMETAMDLYNEKRYELALRYFEAVIEATEDNEKAKLFMARTLAHLGRGDEARRVVDRLLVDEPNDFNLLRVRGRLEFILRRWEPALGYFERARTLKPNSPALLRDIGQVNIRLERWEPARVALEGTIKNHQVDPYTAFYYSQVLEHFREFDEARSVMELAVRLDPRRAPFHHRLGRIAQAQNKLEEAKQEFATAIEIDPTYTESLITLASVVTDEGDIHRAQELLQRAKVSGTVRPVVLCTLEAKIHLHEGKLEEAQGLVEAALQHDREPETLLLAIRVALQQHERGGLSSERLIARTEPMLADLAEKGMGSEAADLRRRLPNQPQATDAI